MSYMNIVKFKVKTESVEAFKAQAFTPKHFEGMIEEHYVQTGVNDYAVVGLWESEEKLVAARKFATRSDDLVMQRMSNEHLSQLDFQHVLDDRAREAYKSLDVACDNVTSWRVPNRIRPGPKAKGFV